MMLGDPALRLLLRLKARGVVRKQIRRLRTPKGLILTLFGLGLFALWLLGVLGGTIAGQATGAEPEQLAAMIRFGGVTLVVMTCVGSLNHRGLFLPGEEIERLFSAPLRRSDLIRYRLQVNLFRSLFATLFISALTMARAPNPLFCFAAMFLGVGFLPVLGQAAAILAGSLEKRFLRYLALPKLILFLAAFAGILWISLSYTVGHGEADPLAWVAELRGSTPRELARHPLVLAITLPFEPWVRAATAVTWSTFLPWIALCAGIWLVAYELAARLPVDFRELSLETSANVAERIRRVRRAGGGASAASLSKRAAGVRVPWLLGRSPMGAIAWRKTCGIVRKARGTLLVSAGVLALLTFVGVRIGRGTPGYAGLPGATFVAGLGTLYLCSGLRFDFRDDLLRMDDIKAWPLAPWRVFLATLLPEVALVSGLLSVGILLQAAIVGAFHGAELAVVAALPLVVLAWVALDNAVFLFAPVRFVPGQDGGLQNAGRTVIMMLLRVALLGVVAVLVALAVVPVFLLFDRVLETERAVTFATATGAGLLVLGGVDALLVVAGGWLFRAFDVARDKG